MIENGFYVCVSMTLSCSVCVDSTMFQKGLMYCMICNANYNLLCKIYVLIM